MSHELDFNGSRLTKRASFAVFALTFLSISLACFGDNGEHSTCTNLCTYEVSTQAERLSEEREADCALANGTTMAMFNCTEGCAVTWGVARKEPIQSVKNCAECLNIAPEGSITLDDYEQALERCDMECRGGDLVTLFAGWGVVWFDEMECS